MQNKNSFVLYAEYRQHLDLLTDEECGRLFKAIMDFAATGNVPTLQGAERMAFSFIQAQMERDNQKYEETRKKRSEAGKLGGRPQKQTKAEKAIGFSDKQSETKKAVYVDDNVDVNGYVDDISPCSPPRGDDVSESLQVEMAQGTAQAATHSTTSHDDETPPPSAPSVQNIRFEEFWKAYPCKVGKKAARKSWDKIRPTAELHSTILDAIATQKKSDKWRRDNGQYIPNPTTWLNQGRWDDEVKPPPDGGGSPCQAPANQFLRADL